MFSDTGFSLDLFSYLFREAQVEKNAKNLLWKVQLTTHFDTRQNTPGCSYNILQNIKKKNYVQVGLMLQKIDGKQAGWIFTKRKAS